MPYLYILRISYYFGYQTTSNIRLVLLPRHFQQVAISNTTLLSISSHFCHHTFTSISQAAISGATLLSSSQFCCLTFASLAQADRSVVTLRILSTSSYFTTTPLPASGHFCITLLHRFTVTLAHPSKRQPTYCYAVRCLSDSSTRWMIPAQSYVVSRRETIIPLRPLFPCALLFIFLFPLGDFPFSGYPNETMKPRSQCNLSLISRPFMFGQAAVLAWDWFQFLARYRFDTMARPHIDIWFLSCTVH